MPANDVANNRARRDNIDLNCWFYSLQHNAQRTHCHDLNQPRWSFTFGPQTAFFSSHLFFFQWAFYYPFTDRIPMKFNKKHETLSFDFIDRAGDKCQLFVLTAITLLQILGHMVCVCGFLFAFVDITW